MDEDALFAILGGMQQDPGYRNVDGYVRIGVRVDGEGRLTRGSADDGPRVRVCEALPGDTVELQVCNETPAHEVSCRVYLPNGSFFPSPSFYPTADGTARWFMRIPAARAAGTRVLVSHGITEIWTELI